MKKHGLQTALGILGLVLLAAGLYLVKTIAEPQGIMRALPYVCIGIGCGLFGQGGPEPSSATFTKVSRLQKQKEIEVNDERNHEISNRSKAKAYDAMVFVFGALMPSFALMNVDVVVVLLLVFAYLFVVGIGIYYRCKLEKEL